MTRHRRHRLPENTLQGEKCIYCGKPAKQISGGNCFCSVECHIEFYMKLNRKEETHHANV